MTIPLRRLAAVADEVCPLFVAADVAAALAAADSPFELFRRREDEPVWLLLCSPFDDDCDDARLRDDEDDMITSWSDTASSSFFLRERRELLLRNLRLEDRFAEDDADLEPSLCRLVEVDVRRLPLLLPLLAGLGDDMAVGGDFTTEPDFLATDDDDEDLSDVADELVFVLRMDDGFLGSSSTSSSSETRKS